MIRALAMLLLVPWRALVYWRASRRVAELRRRYGAPSEHGHHHTTAERGQRYCFDCFAELVVKDGAR